MPGRDRNECLRPRISEARERPPAAARLQSRGPPASTTCPIGGPSCHPFADGRSSITPTGRAATSLRRALAGVAQRMLICGMHVHVGIAREHSGIDLMKPVWAYFLTAFPCVVGFIARSGRGLDTGFRPTAHRVRQPSPNPGCRHRFTSWDEYKNYGRAFSSISGYRGHVEDLVGPPALGEGSHTTRAALRRLPLISRTLFRSPPSTQCLARMLWRLSTKNQRWRIYEPVPRTQGEPLFAPSASEPPRVSIDFGRRQIVPFA